MRKFQKIVNRFFLTLIILLIVTCKNTKKELVSSRVANLPYYNEASFTPKWIATQSDALKSFHQIPNFNFTNQDGEKITQKTFEDKIYVTDFFFTTCPGICPKMTANMDILQKEFVNDASVLLLSHSVTPTIDSVAQLKKYALDKNIGKNWHLVTGDKKEIYDLGRQFYFVEEDLGTPKGTDDFLHTENFVLVDKNKHIRGIYNGLNTNAIQQLIADIKTLKKE
jgi:protein SCO1/2